jgi:stress-induced morphogen
MARECSNEGKMAITEDDLRNLLSVAFPKATILLEDLVGDKDHWSVTIIDPSFAGKSRIEQHRMVNVALDKTLGGSLHALKIHTRAA